jgi:hypothetical protein
MHQAPYILIKNVSHSDYCSVLHCIVLFCLLNGVQLLTSSIVFLSKLFIF